MPLLGIFAGRYRSKDEYVCADFEHRMPSGYFLVKYIFMGYLHFLLFKGIFDYIDGQYRTLPILRWLPHPHLDFYRSFEELCQQEGFNVEEHWVTTEDGYIN